MALPKFVVRAVKDIVHTMLTERFKEQETPVALAQIPLPVYLTTYNHWKYEEMCNEMLSDLCASYVPAEALTRYEELRQKARAMYGIATPMLQTQESQPQPPQSEEVEADESI